MLRILRCHHPKVFLRQALIACLDLILPPCCFACGKALVSNFAEQQEAPFLCPKCYALIQRIGHPQCSCCGTPFISPYGVDHVCGECITITKHFDKARSFGVYEGALLEAIHAFKYGGHARWARPLNRLLFQTFESNWANNDIDLISPVPLHIKRLKKRGFNQAALLFLPWAKKIKIQYDLQLLSRRSNTLPQTGLSKKERMKNIHGVFQIRPNALIEGKNILLVDDVYTTGATVNECARVLKKEGAGKVDILTLARAISPKFLLSKSKLIHEPTIG
ncbi:MAG: ComF family protein [Pseudomonadota bacterium]